MSPPGIHARRRGVAIAGLGDLARAAVGLLHAARSILVGLRVAVRCEGTSSAGCQPSALSGT
jgi:hypothetical protein